MGGSAGEDWKDRAGLNACVRALTIVNIVPRRLDLAAQLEKRTAFGLWAPTRAIHKLFDNVRHLTLPHMYDKCRVP